MIDQRNRYGVRCISRFEFFMDGLKMVPRRLWGDVEQRGDLTMIVALRGKRQN